MVRHDEPRYGSFNRRDKFIALLKSFSDVRKHFLRNFQSQERQRNLQTTRTNILDQVSWKTFSEVGSRQNTGKSSRPRGISEEELSARLRWSLSKGTPAKYGGRNVQCLSQPYRSQQFQNSASKNTRFKNQRTLQPQVATSTDRFIAGKVSLCEEAWRSFIPGILGFWR